MDAALVEDAGDLLVGVIVEQFVDGRDDVGWGLAELVGGQGEWQGEAVVLPAFESDVDSYGVLFRRVASVTRRRTMRLRSRMGVAGLCHRAGKSAASAVMRWRCSGVRVAAVALARS